MVISFNTRVRRKAASRPVLFLLELGTMPPTASRIVLVGMVACACAACAHSTALPDRPRAQVLATGDAGTSPRPSPSMTWREPAADGQREVPTVAPSGDSPTPAVNDGGDKQTMPVQSASASPTASGLPQVEAPFQSGAGPQPSSVEGPSPSPADSSGNPTPPLPGSTDSAPDPGT
jgi:hypothetical protein